MKKLVFGDPSSIELRDSVPLLPRLIELNETLTTGPWKADIEKNTGNNWLVAGTFGNSSIDGKDYILTTDHVHASEVQGDAKTDAEGLAELRNLLPRIIEALRQ